jgi:NAD(P)-dependent dehydrogenase (short-subunit alcohol dehydrogenase family)
MRLENKIAIVTGGSRGVGLAIARGFGREDAQVIIASKNAALEQQDIVRAAILLASDESNWMTGRALSIDGGFSVLK